MKNRSDGERVPEYQEETRRDINRIVRDLGQGGTGLHQSSEDAARRGVTPDLVDRPGQGPADPPEDGGRGH
jgi:hypothetical protein